MLSFIIGLGLLVLIPLFLVAVVFDMVMFMFVFGFKALKIGFKILCAILGCLGLIITVPILLAILIIL